MNIYVGNLNFRTEQSDLEAAFQAYGTVDKATIITDRETGRSRGFGFVEMSNDEEAQAAIDGLNEKDLDGRQLKVNKARPRGERRPRRSSGGGYGGSRGSGGGGSYGGGGYGGSDSKW